MARTALITGISGQDGSYLTEHLQARGYAVHGLFLPGSRMPDGVGAHYVHRHEGCIQDAEAVQRAVRNAQPDECYHLAALTFVRSNEADLVQMNIAGTLNVLEALRRHAPGCRLFLAGSSEMFGDVESWPQTEDTPMRPRNVYGVSKLAALQLMRVYRKQHGLFGCCGILFNHESPRRGPNFVTRKITLAAAAIRAGRQSELRLGNLDATRDWGHARDYVKAMWLMLQQDEPDDYVVATGQPRTVRDFVEAAFEHAGLDWRNFVIVDPEFYSPAERVPFVGCADKASRQLGWRSETDFTLLVREMVDHDLRAAGLPG